MKYIWSFGSRNLFRVSSLNDLGAAWSVYYLLVGAVAVWMVVWKQIAFVLKMKQQFM